jgi:hypothetical protein
LGLLVERLRVTLGVDIVVSYKEYLVSGSLFFLSLKPLARMGATVTGVDAVDKNVKIARLHAVRSLTLIAYH